MHAGGGGCGEVCTSGSPSIGPVQDDVIVPNTLRSRDVCVQAVLEIRESREREKRSAREREERESGGERE